MSNDAKCVCGHEFYDHEVTCLDEGCGCIDFRPAEEAKEKCVCGHPMSTHGATFDDNTPCLPRCDCPKFRPAEEAKSAPESVYERATRALLLIGISGVRDEHDSAICAAINAGEKAEQELAELLVSVWCQFSCPTGHDEVPAAYGGIRTDGGLSILEYVAEELLKRGVLERVSPGKDMYRMVKGRREWTAY